MKSVTNIYKYLELTNCIIPREIELYKKSDFQQIEKK